MVCKKKQRAQVLSRTKRVWHLYLNTVVTMRYVLMGRRMMRPSLLLALLLLLIAVAATSGQGNSNNNNGNGNGNGNNGSSSSTSSSKKKPQKAVCTVKGNCHNKVITCPTQCPDMKPKKNKKNKGCFIDCSSKCEATCKWRKPKCTGYGSLCYDPRFVGGDGVMFYFHGAKGGNFAIVSDDSFQINAHFIGTRPQGRTRDFTWVQALSVMFDAHTLVVAARRLPTWQDNLDALIVAWDGESVSIPKDGDSSEWKVLTDEKRHVVVERTDDLNTVRVAVSGIVEMAIKIRPIGKEEDRIHKYEIPSEDSFAHLEIQFKFSNLSDAVEGVMGKTYRPDYVSPVKVGVPMPMMGGEDKYATPSLYSPLCRACRFQRPSSSSNVESYDILMEGEAGVVAQ